MKKNNEFRKNDKNNPWTKEDEGSHYPIQKEWWCLETIFKTIKDNRKWNLKASLAYQLETPSCFFIYFLFDITNNRCVYHKALNDDINKFKFKKNRVDLSYEKTKITGLYPDYHIHIQDDEKGFIADFDYHAKILPHWSVQDITNGFLPIGLDHYRYGWLLNCDLKGSLKIKDEYKIKGKGYLERAYGNWSYSNPFIRKSNFKKTFSIYNKLVFNWLSQKKIKIPNKISFTTENNPIGYDWFWGIFDNDWSVFYGNSLFWVRQGPGLGVLTLITDDNKYIDFMDYDFKYNKTIFLKKYDVEYPTDLTINAYYKEKKLTIIKFCEVN